MNKVQKCRECEFFFMALHFSVQSNHTLEKKKKKHFPTSALQPRVTKQSLFKTCLSRKHLDMSDKCIYFLFSDEGYLALQINYPGLLSAYIPFEDIYFF